jgi:lysozyme
MRTALRTAVKLCKRFEGLYLKPYHCPAGVATIGYGTVWKPAGTKVTMNDPPITSDVAELWLITQLQRECLPAAVRYTPSLVGDEEALGAITDFIYNLGASRYKSSTLRRRLNERNWDEAQHEIKRWVRANGRILRGLQLRREAEAAYLPQ